MMMRCGQVHALTAPGITDKRVSARKMKEKMNHLTAGKGFYAGWAREAALIQAVKPTVLTFNFEFNRSVIFKTIFIQFDVPSP